MAVGLLAESVGLVGRSFAADAGCGDWGGGGGGERHCEGLLGGGGGEVRNGGAGRSKVTSQRRLRFGGRVRYRAWIPEGS